MTIGWGILIPLGVVGARAKQQLPKKWFNVHRYMQSIGFLVAIGGFAAGFAADNNSVTEEAEVHKDVGITITCLGAVQVLSLVLSTKS